jgi:glutaredoxin 3
MEEIKLYVTPICPYCHTLKNFLKEKSIVFQEIDISQDEKARDYIVEKTGQMEVPIIEIGDEIIIGFDREKIVEKLNIKD